MGTVYKGWKATIYKDGVQLGYVTDVKLDIDTGIEVYREAGIRYIYSALPGPVSISGRFAKAWIDTAYLSLVNVTSNTLTSFDLYVTVQSGLSFYVYDCYWKKGAWHIPQDGILTEDFDFIAKSISVV